MRKLGWISVVLALAPGWAAAEVVDSSSTGFTVRTTLDIHAAPEEVYRKAVRQIGDWWDSAHTFSGSAHNLSIEEKAMGCFCEKLADGGGVRHLEVVYVEPGKKLVMSGALGPLQTMAAAGNMTLEFSAAEGGTKLVMTYAATGHFAAGMNTLAAPVDAVLAAQFTRLKNYIEQGNPAPKPTP
jgi:uncharacterized protein YndB with AHSA1/START domain